MATDSNGREIKVGDTVDCSVTMNGNRGQSRVVAIDGHTVTVSPKIHKDHIPVHIDELLTVI